MTIGAIRPTRRPRDHRIPAAMPPFVAGFTPSFTSSDSCRGKPQSVSTKTHLSSLTIKKRKSPHTSASSGKIFSIKKIFLKLLEITQINEGMIRFTSCTSECSNCSKCSLAARRSPYPSRPSRVLMHLDGMRARDARCTGLRALWPAAQRVRGRGQWQAVSLMRGPGGNHVTRSFHLVPRGSCTPALRQHGGATAKGQGPG